MLFKSLWRTLLRVGHRVVVEQVVLEPRDDGEPVVVVSVRLRKRRSKRGFCGGSACEAPATGGERVATGASTRTQIVEAADRLFYERGYEHTSFTTVAAAVRISRGNFYYHFRTKDDLLTAVIDARLADTRRLLERWEAEEPHPSDRIRRFVHVLLTNRADIQNYGCPVGTLTSELAKLCHPSFAAAKDLFSLFRTWLREQFVLLGHDAQADVLAMHVLAFSQAVATLANTFPDEAFVQGEVDRICDWLTSFTSDRESDIGGEREQTGAERVGER